MSETLPEAVSTGSAVPGDASSLGTGFIQLIRDIISIGPMGLAIGVLIIIIILFGWIILQQTKTILSIREMTTETDRQVASSLQAIASQLSTIQFMLMHKRGPDGEPNETL